MYIIIFNLLTCHLLLFSSAHKPRVRDKARDRVYYQKRKMKEKLAKEREAFGREQTRLERERLKDEKKWNVVRQTISRIKSKKGRKKAIHLFASPQLIKSKRLGKEFGRMFDLSSRSLLYQNRGRLGQKYTKSENTHHLLLWLQDPEHSITCAGKKEKIVCRYTLEGKTIKVTRQIVILTEKLKVLHAVYAAKFPERKCKRTFFQNVRKQSQFIKTLDHAKAQVCLCMKHQNFALKMRSIKKFTKLAENPDTIVRDLNESEFEKAVKAAQKHLPAIIRYEEWRMTPIPVLDPKVITPSHT